MIPVRYAKALLEFAYEKKCAEQVYAEMSAVAGSFEREHALRRVLDMLSKDVDYIIVDTPPCGLLADSVNVARAADCVLYVLGAGAVQIPHVMDSIQFLDEAGTPLLGCVLNGISGGSHSGYGYGYGSYGYGYGYGGYGRERKPTAKGDQ